MKLLGHYTMVQGTEDSILAVNGIKEFVLKNLLSLQDTTMFNMCGYDIHN